MTGPSNMAHCGLLSATPYVVVPDGLAGDARGRALAEPSFVYAWVLDWIAGNATSRDTVYLAPANSFGGRVTEQEAARLYLEARGVQNLVCCHTESRHYVNTRGNARLLRQFLKLGSHWPLAGATLVAYHLHLRRARLVFEQEGFEFADTVGVVPEHFERRPIVRRLWYYRQPTLHRAYEMITTPFFRLKIR
jgi:uncharacterized SAM-binding protein YcdF (DUF218 family)